MIFLRAIVNFFKTIVDTISLLFSIVMSIFETLGMAIKYLITIVGLAIDTVATLPSWLKAFALITIAISVAYFLIGRDTGKSD